MSKVLAAVHLGNAGDRKVVMGLLPSIVGRSAFPESEDPSAVERNRRAEERVRQ
jgi:hypothetical protein